MVIRAVIVGTPLQPVINDSDTQDFSASWSMDSNKLTLNSISFSVNKVRSYCMFAMRSYTNRIG